MKPPNCPQCPVIASLLMPKKFAGKLKKFWHLLELQCVTAFEAAIQTDNN